MPSRATSEGCSLSWKDIVDLMDKPSLVRRVPGDQMIRLQVTPVDLGNPASAVRFIGKTRYLNGARTVVTHSVDDATEHLTACLDAMDQYGIKATAFVNTKSQVMERLWPRLRQAIANGHEIGSHSRRHMCRLPDTSFSCFRILTRYEIEGSRDDILEHTSQPYVWSWAYPCGHCSGHAFVQRKIARAGYLTARAYPGELQGRHLAPGLQTYDTNPYAARYTQVVQNGYTKLVAKKGEVAIAGRNDPGLLNAKFDEVHAGGGIYSFVSHPQMLEYGPDGFYERHLAYIGGRDDVWYVPMGPLYAYRILAEQTSVQQLKSRDALASFCVFTQLDPKIYNGSISLEFEVTEPVRVIGDGRELAEYISRPLDRWDGQYFRRVDGRILLTTPPNTIVEFR